MGARFPGSIALLVEMLGLHLLCCFFREFPQAEATAAGLEA
jgi:hypothetical protein